MTIWTIILYVAVILVALMLIALILVQQSKSGGLGGTFGGVGESLMGGQAGSHLTKATVWMSVVFFALILILATVISHRWGMSEGNETIQNLIDEKAPEVEQVVDTQAVEPVAEKIETPAEPVAEAK